MKLRLLLYLLAVVLGLSCCAPALAAHADMPFNGSVTFHGITLNVPKSFIRDSTQSSEDFWVFEWDWYSSVLLLSHSRPSGGTEPRIQEYVSFMQSIGAELSTMPILDAEAFVFVYPIENVYYREIMFAHRGSIYAIALRGGGEEQFKSILDSVASSHAAANDARSNILNGILKDIPE